MQLPIKQKPGLFSGSGIPSPRRSMRSPRLDYTPRQLRVYVLQIIVALLLRHLQRVHMQPPARPHDGTWAKSARHRRELCVPTAGRLVVGEGAGVRSWRFRCARAGAVGPAGFWWLRVSCMYIFVHMQLPSSRWVFAWHRGAANSETTRPRGAATRDYEPPPKGTIPQTAAVETLLQSAHQLAVGTRFAASGGDELLVQVGTQEPDFEQPGGVPPAERIQPACILGVQ